MAKGKAPAKPRYQAKYGRAYKKREAEARKAVQKYNAAVTRIEKSLGKAYAPPRRSVKDLMRMASNMKELRKEMRMMERIPTVKEAREQVVRKGEILTTQFAYSEAERLNRIRNKYREARRRRYEPLYRNRSGRTISQEESMSKEVPFDERRFRDHMQWSNFKKYLSKDLEKDRGIDNYYQTYLEKVEEFIGKEMRQYIERELGDISPEEFYQMAITEDYNDVFTIEYIMYFPESAEDKIREIVLNIEKYKKQTAEAAKREASRRKASKQ